MRAGKMNFFKLFYIVVIFLFFSTSPFAASIKWKQHFYSHYAEKESLESVLKDLMYGEGIAVSVSKKANIAINIKLERLSPAKALQHLAKVYQFSWYYYGKVLYVSDMTEVQTATLKLVHISPQMFTTAIKDMAIFDDKFSWNFSNQSGIVRFTGPKRLVELVMETATIIDVDEPSKESQLVYTWHDKTGGKHFSSTPPKDKSIQHGLYSFVSGGVTPQSN